MAASAGASGLRYQTVGEECYRVEGLWHVAIETQHGRVIVRPRYENESLDAAFRLAYEVHCSEKRLIDERTLSEDMRSKKMKWDAWDHSPKTLHLLALNDGVLVGRMRIIKDDLLDLPLTNNGFNLEAEKRNGFPIWEISKLLVKKQFRASGLVTPFYWLVYQLCHVEAQLPSIYLSCELALRILYRRIGGIEIGEFFNKEFGQTYSAMRIDFVETYEKQRQGGKYGRHGAANAVGARLRFDTKSLLAAFCRDNPEEILSDWHATPVLGGGGTTTSELWRVSARSKMMTGISREWSCVVKGIRRATPAARDLTCPHPWDHEELIYRRAISNFPSGLTMPRLLTAEASADQIHLFLEDLSLSEAAPIALTDLPQLAKLLGLWHGHAQPDDIARAGWLKWYVESASSSVKAIPTLASTVDALLILADDDVHAQVETFWEKRAAAFEILDSLPQVNSHQDLVARNIFIRDRDDGAREHVLIDWALYGSAPVGAELAPLLFGSALLFAWTADEAQSMLSEVVDAYLSGLHTANIQSSREDVYTGLMLTAALRYIAWGGHRVEAALDISRHAWAENAVGRKLSDIVQRFAEIRKVVLAMGINALSRREAAACI
jgi:predicted GNAT family N-acyltransferase